MLKTQKNAMPEFEKPALGNVQAVCTAVRDIGVQIDKSPTGAETKRHKIVIVWEINQLMTKGEFEGKRFVMSKKFTWTMYEKGSLRPFIESWFAKQFPDEDTACDFDLEKLIGKNCLLNLSLSKDGKYVNISSISPLMQGMTKITPELKPDHVYKWIDELASKAVKAESVPENKVPIKQAPEDAVLTDELDPHDAMPEDVPF
jgi:hypothetical protein